jgi:hypothetical protein
MDDETDHQTERVNDDVTLAALDLLACVKATYPTAFGGFDRLASLFGGLKSSASLFCFAGIGRLSRGLASLRDRRSGPALYGDSEEWVEQSVERLDCR